MTMRWCVLSAMKSRFARRVGQHLAGEEERTFARLVLAGQLELTRLLVERLLFLGLLDQLADLFVESLVEPFAGPSATSLPSGSISTSVGQELAP